ncbi:hypothetical protein AOLI_G00012840 [Acnodon oligacanthus]
MGSKLQQRRRCSRTEKSNEMFAPPFPRHMEFLTQQPGMGEDLRKRLHLEREQVEDQLSESLSGRPKGLTWNGVSMDRVAGRVLSKDPRQCSDSEKSLVVS